jgi:tetratricopeptide (TPR) repeat protein
VDKILAQDKLNQAAKDLRNAAYYHMGIELSRQGKYDEAIETLRRVDPEYDGVAEALRRTTDNELEKAKRLLSNKQYAQAAQKARHILNHDTANKAAADVMNTAYCHLGRDLLSQQHYAQALTVLGRGDPEHECIKKTTSEVAQVSKQQAEAHYLRGVRYFLNEDLAQAIK